MKWKKKWPQKRPWRYFGSFRNETVAQLFFARENFAQINIPRFAAKMKLANGTQRLMWLAKRWTLRNAIWKDGTKKPHYFCLEAAGMRDSKAKGLANWKGRALAIFYSMFYVSTVPREPLDVFDRFAKLKYRLKSGQRQTKMNIMFCRFSQAPYFFVAVLSRFFRFLCRIFLKFPL